MENPEFLQRNLKRLMDSKGWSLKQLAIESGVSYHTVFRAISKSMVPRGMNLQKLAISLGVSVAQLWTDPDKIQNQLTMSDLADVSKIDKLLELMEKRLPNNPIDLRAENERLLNENRKLQLELESARLLLKAKALQSQTSPSRTKAK